MQKNFLTVNILETQFTIKSGNDPQYLGAVVEYLKGKIAEIEQGGGSAAPLARDSLKISLLASLNIVDELFQTRKLVKQPESQNSDELEKITEKLIQTIDASLVENQPCCVREEI